MSELRIDGVSVGPAEIRPVKPGITVQNLRNQLARDGYDQVVFSKGDQLFVATARNLAIPATWNGTMHSEFVSHREAKGELEKDGKLYALVDVGTRQPSELEIPKATLDGQKVRVEWINDEATSFKEGVKRRVFTGAALLGGLTGFGAGISFMQVVTATAKSPVIRASAESAPLWTGIASGAIAGAALATISVLQGGISGALRKPNDAPMKAMTK